mmetsp:Transcript_16179/g.25061  ORF Transcript_16179/g.25061 Transcript_16179/m.25061 type:complete len:113 (-) Transcript_16179:657-995(-)
MPYFRKVENGELDPFFNSIWVVIITMTTVGYGDIAPKTTPGRCVAMVVALWGAFLISLLVVTVGSVFELNENQKMALRHIRLTRKAATTLSSGIKYFLAKKRYYLLLMEVDP